jgi:transcriptional regulator
MYMPAHFAETDLGRLHDAIEEIGLGALVVSAENGLQADHVPFVLDRAAGDRGVLLAHVARSNDLWRQASAQALECLIVFQGPSAYISPNWYPTKGLTHEVVPTYNYVMVHAHGRIVVHDDARWVRTLVSRLTRNFEAAQERPWKMGDAPAAFLDGMLANIVGLEIAIDRIEGKWKMSQNRNAADRAGVVRGLTEQGGDASVAVAGWVAKETRPD